MSEQELIEQYTHEGWQLIEDTGYVGLVEAVKKSV